MISRGISLICIFVVLCHITVAQIDEADHHFHQGDTFLLFNKHDSSIYHFEKAREIYLQEQYIRGVIASDNKIAENLCGTFKLKHAMELAEEAYKMADEHLGQWDIEKANALNNIGNIHYLTGQHELALKEYERALDISNHETHEEVLFSAPTSLGIGNVYFGKHQYEEAFRHFQMALDANIKILGRNHPYVANSYLSLGNLYRNKGSYNLATEYYDQALKINIRTFGEHHPDVATTYIGIGDIYQTKGTLDLAMQYYRQAMVIYKRFLHPMNPKFGAIYLGIAEVYIKQGNYEGALDFYKQALDLYEKTIGLEHQNSVQCYLGIGNTYMAQEHFKEALEYYNKVLDINFKLVGENHANSSKANYNMGAVYYLFGDFELAIRYYRKSLDIDIAIHGDKHPDVAAGYFGLSSVYGEMGELQTALEYCQSAINSSIIDFDDSNVFINPVLINFFDNRDLLWYLAFKGRLLEEGFGRSENVKGLDISLESFVLSDSLVEQIRQTYTDRRDQVQLSEQAHKIYESSVNASYDLLNLIDEENVKFIGADESYEQKKKEYENRFFYFTEKNKGAILFSSLAESNAKSFGGIPDSLLSKETELKDIINSFTQELSANPDSAMLEFYQRELFKANREYEGLIERFETDYPKYFDLKYDVDVTSLSEIQEFLNDSTMMVSYFITSDNLYVAYIDSKGMKISKVEKEYEYERAIKGLRKGILFKSDRIYLEYASMLYKQLFPMDIPDHIKDLIIVQDGIMATVPFEVLLTKEVYPDSVDYSQLPYLIRDFNVSYTFSANLLYKTFRNEKLLRDKAEKDGMVIAPVSFENSLDALKVAKEKSYKESNTAKSLRKGIAMPPSEIVPLPGTKIEASTIDTLFSQNHKEAADFIGEDAKEDLAKSGEMDKYNYIHIASHGFVNQEEPEFSGIFMVPGSDTGGEDGILFAGEVYNINLNSELVTLSACETGLGKITKGEGIIGLTRALIYAGAKNITVSLWKVSDASTQKLMIDYYSEFLPLSIPQDRKSSLSYAYALKVAKMKMIQSGGEFSHPYYWSPFVLIGK